MFNKGKGVAQDFVEAVNWYKLAAGQGDADAQNNLGAMYAKGIGVIQDYVKSHSWFNLSAVNGNSLAL
jgi:TPR repeat protein